MAHVGVIGAGPSGLAAIKELLAEGHTVACYEKAPGVGGLFRYDEENGHVWKSLRLTSSAAITGFSDFPMPDDLPPHATHEQYTQYLNDYCDHFQLRPHISFDTEVESLRRRDDGWVVAIKAHDGSTSTHHFDAVAVCSGIHQFPYSPELAGQEDFEGEFFHSSKYRSPERFEGRSVVFMGLGESGSDVVGEIAAVTKKSWLSLRRGAAVTPRFARDLPTDYRTTRLVYSMPKWLARPSSKATDAEKRRRLLRYGGLGAAVLSMLPMWPFYIADGLREIAFKRRPKDRKRLSIRRRLADMSGAAFYEQFGTKSDSFLDALVDGSCEQKPEIEKLTPKGVRFVDGSEVAADVVLFCTGYKPGFPFLEGEYDEFRDLYKNCFVPSVGHTLCLIGGARPAFGSIPPVSEMQARWFALLMSNKLALPSEAEMKDEVQMCFEMTRRNFFPVAQRLHYLIDYPHYMDDVAGIIGCKPSFSSLLRKPRLLRKLYCCPMVSTQYRLEGPHAKPELAEMQLLKLEEGPHPNTVLLAALAACKLLSRIGFDSFKLELSLPWRRPSNPSLDASSS